MYISSSFGFSCGQVLDLKSFDQGIITGLDSPIHMTTDVQFDTAKEQMEKVKKLK